jgi:hypothetical protein
VSDKLDKLPKWARDHIRHLEVRVETLEATIAKRNGEAVGGRIIVDPYGEDERLVFPNHTNVRFAMSDTGWRDYFEVRLKDNRIEVISLMPESD